MKKGMLAGSLFLVVGIMFVVLASVGFVSATPHIDNPDVYAGNHYGFLYFNGPISIASYTNFVPASCWATIDNGAHWYQIAVYNSGGTTGCYVENYAPGQTITIKIGAYLGSTPYISIAETFTYDATGPSLTASGASSSWYGYQRTATISASDSGSGLYGGNQVRYNWGWSSTLNSACTSGGTLTSNGATLNAPAGGSMLYLCARDMLGNTRTWNGLYRWENTAPSVSASSSSSTWYNYQRTAIVSASDSGGSGLSSVTYKWNGNWGYADCWNTGTSTSNGATLNAPVGENRIMLCARDGAGNPGMQDPQIYRWENTAPTCGTWSPASSPWKASGAQAFTLSGSTDSGGSGINVASGSCTTGTTNGATCTVTISDVAGNTRVCTSPVNNIDSTAPTCGTWSPASSPWKTSGSTTFTLSGSTDSGGSGINTAGGTCTTGASNGATCTVTISDKVGNTRVCTSPVNNIDSTAPTCGTWSPTSSPWKTSGSTTFTLSGSTDSGGSGIRTIEGGSSSCTTGTTNGATCTKGISDNAGNTATCTSPTNNIDSTAPSVSATGASELWYNYQLTATISASDSGGSGLAEVRYNWGSNLMNGACTSGGAVTSNGATLNAPVNGAILYLCVRDGAGNTATWSGTYNWENVNITSIYWADLTAKPIDTLGINQDVLMIVSGLNLAEKYINYTVYEQVNVFFFSILKRVDLISGTGISKTSFTNEGEYKFKAKIQDIQGETNSELLNVSAEPVNNPPVAIITAPADEFNISSGTNISFNQASYDSDNILTITWDFGDGTTQMIYNYMNCSGVICSALNGSYNLTANTKHSYSTAGPYVVTLSAEEETGTEHKISSTSKTINVFNHGINVFPVISSPEGGKIYSDKTVNFNANNSFVTNCSYSCPDPAPAGGCFQVGNLFCYYLHHSSLAITDRDYNLFIKWSLEPDPNVKFPAGNWFKSSGSNDVNMSVISFYRYFVTPNERTVKLYMEYVPSS